MAKKRWVKRGFDLVKNAEEVFHYLDVGTGSIGTTPSAGTRDLFLTNQAIPLTVASAAGAARPLQYELSRTAQRPSVAERTCPIGMLQRLVQGDYHVVLSEHQIGASRIQYMRLGAKRFEAFENFPAHERIANSEPRSGELKIAHPDHAHEATAWLLQGKSIHDLNPDGSLKAATFANQFDNKPFA